MPRLTEHVEMSDFVARKDQRTNLAAPALCDFATSIELGSSHFTRAGVFANDDVRERMAGQFLMHRAVDDRLD